MKRHGILNPALASLVASVGHGQLIGIADAGLPIPSDLLPIDLALVRGVPDWPAVIAAVAPELVVEGYVLAEESRAACPEFVAALADAFPGATASWVPHSDFKTLCGTARGVVRTGSTTPYSNVLLRSGVDFDSARPSPRATPSADHFRGP